jgi:type I restriction enzyme S subunit
MGNELVPNLPAGWKSMQLIDCTTDNVISYGIVQPGQHTDGGIPIIRVNNFGNGKLDLSTVLKVTPEIESKFSRTRLAGGEVLLTLVGSTGQSIVAPPVLAGWNVPRAVAVIRVADDVGANWINICLQTEFTKHFLDSRANTTVQKTLNLSDVKKIPIPIPPKSIKEFIESNITSLEKKIELNRRTNQTLETMAQALFKSWFVDFDPVIDNALEAGNPIPEELQDRAERRKQQLAKPDHKPLPEDIRQLFPSEFELTEELGWVPKGWEVLPFIKVIDKYIDNRGKTPPLVEEGIPLVEVKHLVGNGSFPNLNTSKKVSQEIFEIWFRDHLKAKDILISTVGTIGRTSFVKDTDFGIAQNVLGLRFEKTVKPEYMFQTIKANRFQHDMEDRLVTTVQSSIKRKDLNTIKILVPSYEIQSIFSSICDDYLNSENQRSLSLLTLVELRDALLPKLISGELRLPSEALAEADQ